MPVQTLLGDQVLDGFRIVPDVGLVEPLRAQSVGDVPRAWSSCRVVLGRALGVDVDDRLIR